MDNLGCGRGFVFPRLADLAPELFCDCRKAKFYLDTRPQWFDSSTSLVIDAISMADDKSIGIIGMGDMGKMYARRLSGAGWK